MIAEGEFKLIHKIGVHFLENLYMFLKKCYIIHMFSVDADFLPFRFLN